jgi:hypothetical protein
MPEPEQPEQPEQSEQYSLTNIDASPRTEQGWVIHPIISPSEFRFGLKTNKRAHSYRTPLLHLSSFFLSTTSTHLLEVEQPQHQSTSASLAFVSSTLSHLTYNKHSNHVVFARSHT